jgi:hypothetical protein
MIETLRARIAALQAEREALQAQRRSRAEIATHVSQTVDQWATTGKTSIVQDLQRLSAGQPIELLNARGPGLNMGALLTAMIGADKVKGAILANLQAIPESLDTAARMARIRELTSTLDDLETQEELLIVKSGDDIQRRANCRPEIVLGC